MIIGICGLIGSGKDTIADYLVAEHDFTRLSFATTLKDAASLVFDWDRELLEGRTDLARHWREQVDPWWAERLNFPKLTPRWVLQYWGTEVLRNHFHDDIWVASLENKLRKTTRNVVITDCRFPNEVKAIRKHNGLVLRVKRGIDPEWFEVAERTNRGETNEMKLRSDVHPSEWSWAGTDFDAVLNNDSSKDELYLQVKSLVLNHLASN